MLKNRYSRSIFLALNQKIIKYMSVYSYFKKIFRGEYVTHAYIYTYIHTYIHIYIQSNNQALMTSIYNLKIHFKHRPKYRKGFWVVVDK